jgi:hypothetical protein
MANDFEYATNNRDSCATIWPEESIAEVHFLEDWGIGELSSIEEMESWYEKVHVEVFFKLPEVTGSSLKFSRLKKEWIRGTARLSVLSQIVLHPAYQQIIAIGPEAIPLILRSLADETDHWFWALKVLNDGVDVAEGTETMAGAAQAWLAWGREKGHLDF